MRPPLWSEPLPLSFFPGSERGRARRHRERACERDIDQEKRDREDINSREVRGVGGEVERKREGIKEQGGVGGVGGERRRRA